MKSKFMEGKTGKWIKRIVVILIVVGLLAFGAYKLFLNKSYNVEKTAKETLDNLTSYYMEANMEFFKGEDSRKYDIKISYQKGTDTDLYKVSMYDKAALQAPPAPKITAVLPLNDIPFLSKVAPNPK